MQVSTILLSIGLSLTVILTASASSDYTPREAKEFSARDGLPNFFHKLEQGSDVTIAYLGGSITAQNGWRVQSQDWFEAQYPEAKIHGIHAAIGGTGSDLGVFRVDKDALQYEPDLLFVEFAVNDAGARPENIIKAMEGIVRKTWQANPKTDICFVYTVTFRESQELANGTMKRSASVMEAVADHYGIPSVHMGYQAALLEKAGKLVMKTDAEMTAVSGSGLNEAAELATDAQGRIIFSKDGVHPYTETGHVLYTEALIRSMEQIQANARPTPHNLPAPIREDHWAAAQQFTIPESALSGPYSNLTEQGDPLAKQFAGRLDTLYRLEPGASLRFKFKGTKVSIYDLLGPDGCLVEITVDGKSRESRRMDGYCTYTRIGTLGVGDNMPDTIHEVSIRVLDKQFDKSEVLFERNRHKMAENPEAYESYLWHPSSIFLVGELVE